MVTENALKIENKDEIACYYEEIRKIYVEYRTIVRPFVAFLELFDSEFPVEILNEIRAIFQHLARCYYSEYEDYDSELQETSEEASEDVEKKKTIDVKKNIEKAKSHINRALLDCFKYSCLTLFDEYKAFMNMYKYVDISSLDNGEFLKKLHILKENARIADKEARSLEGDSGDDVKVFRLYEEAFNKSMALYDYIAYHAKYAARLKRKLRIFDVGAAIGWIIGVASGIHALWTAFRADILAFFSSLCK